jgi:hypothetical protein
MQVRPTRRKPKALTRDPREKLIEELESLIRDHRAGRDVLNRIAEGSSRSGAGAVRLSCALTLALHGWEALPDYPHTSGAVWYPDCDGIQCDASEHATLEEIGHGRAEEGAARLVSAALSWLERDRPGFLKWAGRALRSLSPRMGNPVEDHGLFGAERWEVPVAGDWFSDFANVAEELERGSPLVKRQLRYVSAWDLFRAMLAEWDRPGFRALIVMESPSLAQAS